MTKARRQTGNGGQVSCAHALLAVALVLILLPPRTTRGEPLSQPLVEAGFITKFPLFVTWPADTWQTGDAPFVIGVIGETPVREHLDDLANYATADGHPLVVHTVATLSAADRCHLLFIAADAEPDLEEILAQVVGKPILTVSNCDGYARRGVHINFYLDGEYVRFEINQRASEASNLTLSFRLKNVARLVD